MAGTGRDLLGSRYEVGRLLGRGGMGEVRAGNDLRLGRSVAIKTLRRDLAAVDGVRRRFETEARAAAASASSAFKRCQRSTAALLGGAAATA